MTRRGSITAMTNEDVNITTRQLAELISVDPSTVRKWIETGKLTPAVVTAGGHYRFNKDAALAELTSHSTGEQH